MSAEESLSGLSPLPLPSVTSGRNALLGFQGYGLGPSKRSQTSVCEALVFGPFDKKRQLRANEDKEKG